MNASAQRRPLNLGPVIADVEGLSLSAQDRRRLRHPLVGGVVLFARNFESRRQLMALCEEIRALREHRLLVCVDHEGGRVQRFRQGFTRIPPMRELGELWDNDPMAACRRATELGQIIGSELREAGVDLSFAPVLDLDHGSASVIGDRALHADPRVVTLLARSLTHGLLLSGLANCAKHFPGHGYARTDSHHALPFDERRADIILATDAAPYGWMGDALAAVMPAHVVYPDVDRESAGFSRVWLKDVLRKRLGFSGLVVSDDLCMQAAAAKGGIVQRARAALNAGCDMALVCNRPDLVDELLDGLRWKAGTQFAPRLARLFAR